MKSHILTTTFSMKFLNNIIYHIIPILVLLSIWMPLLSHYYVKSIVVTDDMTERSRYIPHDSVFTELKSFRFGIEIPWDDDRQLITAAEKILQGEVEIPGFPYTKIGIPFDSDDIDKG